MSERELARHTLTGIYNSDAVAFRRGKNQAVTFLHAKTACVVRDWRWDGCPMCNETPEISDRHEAGLVELICATPECVAEVPFGMLLIWASRRGPIDALSAGDDDAMFYMRRASTDAQDVGGHVINRVLVRDAIQFLVEAKVASSRVLSIWIAHSPAGTALHITHHTSRVIVMCMRDEKPGDDPMPVLWAQGEQTTKGATIND